jgi:hypothetical protein
VALVFAGVCLCFWVIAIGFTLPTSYPLSLLLLLTSYTFLFLMVYTMQYKFFYCLLLLAREYTKNSQYAPINAHLHPKSSAQSD